jgi:membrane protein DedA with SNARE-associated domain
MPFVPFVVYTVIGCIPFVAALATIGVALGPHWEKAHHILHYGDYVVALALVAAVGWSVHRWRRSRTAA